MAAYPIDKALGWHRTGQHDAFGAATGGRTFPHTGSDFASYGAKAIPIYATEAGKVIRAGNNSTTGNYVIIAQPSGWWMYAHMSSRAVAAGQAVSEGQRIGTMGATGRAWGVHLHITRFTSLQAALSNPIPTTRLKGQTLAQWAALNRLADPMQVINGAKTTAQTQEQKEEAELMAAKDEIMKHTQAVMNNAESRILDAVDQRVKNAEWRMRREVRMRVIYVKDDGKTVENSPMAALVSLSGGGVIKLNDPDDRQSQLNSLAQNYITMDTSEVPTGMDTNSFLNQIKDIVQAQENVNAIIAGRKPEIVTQEDVKVAFGWK